MTKRVLIVEDYEDTRTMMKFMVEDSGYTVIEAGGPYEAIEKASEFHPDLILMDIGLPLMDGLSAARIIKDADDTAHVPIVAVTAYSDVLDQVLEAGCQQVLYKPIQPEELHEVLNIHLTEH